MAESPEITIVLLAGGLATRLPDKLALPIEGEPMLARVYRRLAAGGRHCIISTRTPAAALGFAALGSPAQFVIDEYPDAGPLGGLVSGAAHVRTPLFFAAAGDMPNIDASFVDALAQEFDAAAGSGTKPEAVVPTWPDGKREPLAAVYDTHAFLHAGRQMLAAGERKVMAAVDTLKVIAYAVQAEDEVKLANVNTRSDYEAHSS